MKWFCIFAVWLFGAAALASQGLASQDAEPPEQGALFDESAIRIDLPSGLIERNGAGAETAESAQINSSDFGGLVSPSLYLRVFLILGFLIVLIYLTLRFLRRLSLKRLSLPSANKGIQVLGTQVLYGDRMVHVVEVGGECYLLGSSSGGVDLLDHYTEQEVKDRVILEATQNPQPERTGRAEGVLGKGDAFVSPQSALDFLQMVRRRLKPNRADVVQPQTGSYRRRLREVAAGLRKGS